MRSWIESRYPTDLGTAREVPRAVRLVRVGAGPLDSLRTFRCNAIAAALAGMLTSRGYEAIIESGARSQRAAVEEPQSVEIRSGTGEDHSVEVPVGSVDVRYGSLRMRSGGSLGVEDAESELARALATAGPERSHKWCASNALSALKLAMLATPRAKHLHLDERWVQRAAHAFAEIADSLSGEATADRRKNNIGVYGDTGKGRIRELAIELNGLHWQCNRAAAEFEPAHLARFATMVAMRLNKARLVDQNPLQAAGKWVMETAISLLQIGWPAPQSVRVVNPDP